jgi:tripartite-type tricarboxylate transporter receptor subunit TctC
MQTLQSPDVRERFAAEGIEALGGTPDQFAEYIRSEIARWGRVIKEAGVRPE